MGLLTERHWIERRYDDVGGLPQSWRNVDVAWLKGVVYLYREQVSLTPTDVARLVDFADYWIGAPAWTRADSHDMHRFAVPVLRRSIKHVESVQDFDTWRMGARAVGLDPFEAEFGYWGGKRE